MSVTLPATAPFQEIALADAIQGTAQDVLTVRRNLRTALLKEKSESVAARWLAEMQPDGSWKDQIYTDTNREGWKAVSHLPRLLGITRAYYTPGNPFFNQPEVKAKILASLKYWLDADPQNTNWWHNEIGVPKQIGELLLLLDADASQDLKERGVNLMLRSKWEKWTGQNLVWGALIQIMRGCIVNSPALVGEAYGRMWSEVHYAEPGKEGIQVDHSFHQHGSLLYAGGYGAGFTSDITRFQMYAQGTAFELPPAKRAIMEKYILDGQQWMIRGSMWDFGVTGRELIRAGKSANPMLEPVNQLASLPGPRQKEFAAFAARLRGDAAAPPISGNRYYWKSDYMTQQRRDYMVSTRMFSTRTLNTDGFINGENKKSHHLADGATFIARTGQEYFDIAPVWDWHRIPGTTVEQNTPLEPKQVKSRDKTDFVGGVSNGRYGCAAMDLVSGALTAKKAWFYFDDQIVCLGAGISCPTENPVFTSINQCLLSGDFQTMGISTGTNTGSFIPDKNSVEYTTFVWHDGVGYIFPEPTIVQLHRKTQSGSLREVGPWSDARVERPVFSLWLDHGRQVKDATYAYIIAPGESMEKVDAINARKPIEILSNTPALQAARHKELDLLQVCFREPGTIKFGVSTLTVDQPCLVLFQRQKSKVHIAVSNPLAAALDVNLTVNQRFTGNGVKSADGHSTIELQLPGGQAGGSSVTWEGRLSKL